jgi:MSHA biogenesis protein MshL
MPAYLERGLKLPMRRCLLLLTFVLLSACGISNPYRWSSETTKNIDRGIEKAGKTDAKAAVPADVSEALLPALGTRQPDGRGGPLETRFDLSVSNAPARQVFLSLVEGTPYSIVLHPDVSGKVSLQLKGVTVPQTLEVLRRMYGYHFRREGNRYFILGGGMQTRIFPVNYLTMNRRGKSDTRVTSGIQSSGTPGGSGASGSGSAAGGATPTSITGIRVETDSKADFWKELQESLSAIIGTEGGRKIIVNPQASLVVVRAMPEDLRTIEEYLGITHATVNRQVVLEAKILEVKLSEGYQAGINWAALTKNGIIAQTGGGSIFGDTLRSDTAGGTGNLTPGGPVPTIGTPFSAFGGVISAAFVTANFASFLEFLQAQGEVQVLSSPRVSTLNNQKAVIKVGTDEFFITNTTSTPSGVFGVAPSVSTELSPFFSGIALDVTPQIDDAGNIVLHIHPAVSEVLQKTINFTLGGTGGGAVPSVSSLPTALSNIQESDNVVRAQSGQVVVIGGLMKEGSTDKNASVPFFGDIPLIGNLFKQKQVARTKSELVILLKPTIVEIGNDQHWADSISESRERLRSLNP